MSELAFKLVEPDDSGREISALELLEHYLERSNGTIPISMRSLCSTSNAPARAKEADAALARGEL